MDMYPLLQLGVWEGYVHTGMYTALDNQTGTYCIPHGTHSILCGILDGRGVWRRMDTCMCMVVPLLFTQCITTLLIGSTPYNFFFLNQDLIDEDNVHNNKTFI